MRLNNYELCIMNYEETSCANSIVFLLDDGIGSSGKDSR